MAPYLLQIAIVVLCPWPVVGQSCASESCASEDAEATSLLQAWRSQHKTKYPWWYCDWKGWPRWRCQCKTQITCEPEPFECRADAAVALGAGQNADSVMTEDPFEQVWVPRTMQQEQVRQAVAGDDWQLLLQLDNSTTFSGFVRADGVIDSVSDVRRVYAGEYFAYFQLLNGSWLSAGDNSDGQLGLGPPSGYVQTPQLVEALEGLDIVHAALGDEHAIFVLANGSALGVGDNTDGELGLDSTEDQEVPVRLPVEGVRWAAAGEDFSILVLRSGRVLVAGENNDGQLGLGPDAGTADVVTFTENPFLPPHVVSAAAGDDHALFLMEGGYVFGSGQSDNGQLGIENETDQLTPVWVPVEDVRQVVAGNIFTVFVKCDGSVFATGANGDGQLGLGSFQDQRTPVRVPSLEDVICGHSGPDSEHVLYLAPGAKDTSLDAQSMLQSSRGSKRRADKNEGDEDDDEDD